MAKTTKSKTKSTKAAGDKSAAKTKKKAQVEASGEAESTAAHAEGSAPAKKSTKKSGQKAAPRRPLAPQTPFVKWGEGQNRWVLIDAKGQTLGRLSSHIARLLMGKDKPSYTRFSDTGDHVVVINARQVVLTGKKVDAKEYHYHTNYPGGIKTFTAKDLLRDKPERLIEWAVYGMLPKGHMGRRWYKKLRVFAGSEHPHTAQQPQPITLPDLGSWERA
jgi:large subunit ribosomal protein L13